MASPSPCSVVTPAACEAKESPSSATKTTPPPDKRKLLEQLQQQQKMLGEMLVAKKRKQMQDGPCNLQALTMREVKCFIFVPVCLLA